MNRQLEDGEEVQDYEQFHGKLSEKLLELEEQVPENYEMTVEYAPFGANSDMFETKDRVSITIESDDDITNKGEGGLSRFHVILRERGGIELLTRYPGIGKTQYYLEEYDKKSMAWQLYLGSIERAI